MPISSNSYVVISYFLAAGITFAIGFQAALIALAGYRTKIYRLFAAMSIGATGYLLSTAYFYMAVSVPEAAYALKLQCMMLTAFFIPFFPFLALYTGQRQIRQWAIGISLLFICLMVANILSPYGLRFATLGKNANILLPWGELLPSFSGVKGNLFVLARGMYFSMLGWGLYRSFVLYKNGQRSDGFLLFIGLGLLFASGIWGALIDSGVVHSFYVAGFAYLALVLLMSITLARDLKAHTQEVQETAQELRIAAIAFDTQEGILVINDQQVIVRVNNAFCRLTGYSLDEVIGETPAIFDIGENDSISFTSVLNIVTKDGCWRGETSFKIKKGELLYVWLNVSSVVDSIGNITNLVCTISDISQDKASEAKIHHLAFYDFLTNLPNRRLLIDRLEQALAASDRKSRYGALLFIDLDNFKLLNDSKGHTLGDLLLVEMANGFKSNVREGDTVARLGGDEFVVVLNDLGKQVENAVAKVELVGEKLLETARQNFVLQGHEYATSASIGVCLFNGNGDSIEELLKRSDAAMYQAKRDGRNALRFYDPEMQAILESRMRLESWMRTILPEQLILFYQPKIGSDGKIYGAEALLRWQHPEQGMISPADFIPLAEETGLIHKIGEWVLQEACNQLKAWERKPGFQHIHLSVNVSAKQIHQSDFVDKVLAIVESSGANPEKLNLELTESTLVKKVEDVIEKMTHLQSHGLRFSLDDFGTGYSSLTYLKRLPLDELKIDQSFVRDILTDPNDAAIAKTIIALSQSLELSVIAEGVEFQEQLDFLSLHGCNRFQGYFFGKPVPVTDFEQMVIRTNSD